MSKLIYTLFVVLLIGTVKISLAQHTIMVQRNGMDIPFYNMDSVLTNIQAGDSVILPGGILAIPGGVWQINHEVHILGVGYRVDSSSATGATTLIGSLLLITGADNSSITGINLMGWMHLGANNQGNVNNCSVSRCYIYGKLHLWPPGTNNMITESIIIGANSPGAQFGSVWGNYTQGNTYRNNIFVKSIKDYHE